MNLSELIEAFRIESGDSVNKPYFWSDSYLTFLANEAESEACRRAGLLRDSTSSFCEVDVAADEPLITLDPAIITVLRARLSTVTGALSSITSTQMDDCEPLWETHTGRPTSYVPDYQTGALRLYPIPNVDDVLFMTVSRLPVRKMEDDEDVPEIRPEYHYGLVHWMLYRAYMKQDADTFAPGKAAVSLAEFEKEFGKRSSARNETWQRERHTLGGNPIA